MDAFDIILRYYPHDDALRRLLLHHSRQVMRRALRIAARHPELGMDRAFLVQAALLHDVGIFMTKAPSIHCHGTHPYLLHGYLGAELLRSHGMNRLARVCERHTGTGLTPEQIAAQQLPLPPGSYVPETPEEQLLCYADKFYSKSHLDRCKTLPQAEKTISRFGDEGLQRFLLWERMFE